MASWISGAEAALQLGVTAPTIRSWVRCRRLDGYVAGRVTRVRPESVQKLVCNLVGATERDRVVAPATARLGA